MLYSINIKDFSLLHAHWISSGRQHSGIVLGIQQRYPVGEQPPITEHDLFAVVALTPTSGTPQSAIVDGAFPSVLTVSVTNPQGAPVNGLTINLAAVPASVTVPPGATASPAFTITTTAVTTLTDVTISGAYRAATKTATLQVNSPQLAALTLRPTTVDGGQATSHNALVLNGAAPQMGRW